jgi:hypothetical protein
MKTIQDLEPFTGVLRQSVQGWTFQPARENGRAVGTRVLVAGLFRPAMLLFPAPDSLASPPPDSVSGPRRVRGSPALSPDRGRLRQCPGRGHGHRERRGRRRAYSGIDVWFRRCRSVRGPVVDVPAREPERESSGSAGLPDIRVPGTLVRVGVGGPRTRA